MIQDHATLKNDRKCILENQHLQLSEELHKVLASKGVCDLSVPPQSAILPMDKANSVSNDTCALQHIHVLNDKNSRRMHNDLQNTSIRAGFSLASDNTTDAHFPQVSCTTGAQGVNLAHANTDKNGAVRYNTS